MTNYDDVAITPGTRFTAELEQRLLAELARLPLGTDPLPGATPTTEVPLVSVPHPRRRPVTLFLGAGLAAAALLALVIVLATRDDDQIVTDVPTTTLSPATTTGARPGSTTTVASTTTTTTAPTVSAVRRTIDELPAAGSLEDIGAIPVASLTGPAFRLATDGTIVWAAIDSGPILGFDDSGALVQSLDIVNGEHAQKPIVAFGSLWALMEIGNQLRRFDPATGELQVALDLPGLVGGQDPHLAATDEAVHVITQEDGPSILTIDPATTAVTNRVPVSSTTFHIAADSERLYGFSLGSASVIDPETGRQDPTAIAAQGYEVATGFSSVWALVGMGSDTLVRLDASTLELTAEIDLTPIGKFTGDSTVTDAAVWVMTQKSMVVKIDPAENRVVGRYGPETTGGGITATPTALWFTDAASGTLYRAPLT